MKCPGQVRWVKLINWLLFWAATQSVVHTWLAASLTPLTGCCQGVTDRVSGFTDGKKQISRCQQGIDAPDARALYEKVQMLQNQNDELRQRIVALEAENKRQTVSMILENMPLCKCGRKNL